MYAENTTMTCVTSCQEELWYAGAVQPTCWNAETCVGDYPYLTGKQCV